jgi:hypothetical protein
VLLPRVGLITVGTFEGLREGWRILRDAILCEPSFEAPEIVGLSPSGIEMGLIEGSPASGAIGSRQNLHGKGGDVLGESWNAGSAGAGVRVGQSENYGVNVNSFA